MRYTPDHKERSRERILSSASQLMRCKGIDAVSVATAMKEAGMTHGAFYAHFQSKDDLVAESIRFALDKTIARLRDAVAAAPNEPPLKVILASYLTESHLRNTSNGCATASMGQQAARSSPLIRQAMAEKIDKMVDFIAMHCQGSESKKRATAHTIYSMMVGTIVLAMNYEDPDRQREILESGRENICLAFGS